MTEQELKLSTKLIKNYASQPDADEKIELLLESLFACYPQEQKDSLSVQKNAEQVSSVVTFTQKEIQKMHKTFKKEFIANGLCAHILKRVRYTDSVSYLIRYRRNGYCIVVYGATIEEAKKNFVKATLPENIEKYRKKEAKIAGDSVRAIGEEWLRSKDGKIDPRTFRDYKMNCETRIFPIIGDRPIASIRTNDIMEIINSGKGRVIETLQTIFKGIMMYALANGDILFNPMQAVKFQKVKRNTRRALTKEEEKKFFERIELPEFEHYKPFLLLQYYFGLRPWELTEVRFENDFLIALNAKHEDNGEKVYKKIPIPEQLKGRIDFNKPIVFKHKTDVLNRAFKRLMEDESVTQYYLRHTFSTTCQQYVRPDIVDIWMGDSSERLVGRVYTHFPDEFLQEQMKLVKFFA